MFKQNKIRKFTVITLSFLLMLGIMPMTALANENIAVATWEIVAFSPLAEEIRTQAVPIGGSMEDIDLPNTLFATLRLSTVNYHT